MREAQETPTTGSIFEQILAERRAEADAARQFMGDELDLWFSLGHGWLYHVIEMAKTGEGLMPQARRSPQAMRVLNSWARFPFPWSRGILSGLVVEQDKPRPSPFAHKARQAEQARAARRAARAANR